MSDDPRTGDVLWKEEIYKYTSYIPDPGKADDILTVDIMIIHRMVVEGTPYPHWHRFTGICEATLELPQRGRCKIQFPVHCVEATNIKEAIGEIMHRLPEERAKQIQEAKQQAEKESAQRKVDDAVLREICGRAEAPRPNVLVIPPEIARALQNPIRRPKKF